MKHSQHTEDISAVILWVDGDDPAHIAKREKYLNNKSLHMEGTRNTRFRSVGEIDYCILSILKFAPFISRIFILTDSQTPPLLKRINSLPTDWQKKLRMVDHREIFINNEHILPTFNSLSIATALHKIPDLSEKFILFNDDIFLIKPMKEDYFFKNGRPVYRGHWTPQPHIIEIKRRLKTLLRSMFGKQSKLTPTYQRSQIKAAKMAGYLLRYFRLDHTPKPLLKKSIESIFKKNPQWLHSNIFYRSRDINQFHTPSLACHFDLLKKEASTATDLGLLYLEPQHLKLEELINQLTTSEFDDSKFFACIQSLDEAKENHITATKQWLNRVIDNPTNYI